MIDSIVKFWYKINFKVKFFKPDERYYDWYFQRKKYSVDERYVWNLGDQIEEN